MLTLCINTAGHINTLAIVKDNQLIAEENWESERNETETILPKLEGLLSEVELKIKEIEALNIIQGVGGFTSLRVGISIANTIAYDLNVPIYGTSVFELWTNRFTEKDLAILIDAGRQECFYFSTNKAPLNNGNTRDSYSPQIIPNAQLSELKEGFWVGEINENQQNLLSQKLQKLTDLKTPGEAFAAINLKNKAPQRVLEPWYGREPNISKAKKKVV